MKTLKNILVAIDLSEEAQVVLRRAMELAEFYNAGLHLIHVIEPVGLNSPYELNPSLPEDMQSVLEQRAENYLDRLCADIKLAEIPHTVSVGSIKQKIFEVAQEYKIDLIVVGTHGRHGIGLLLGSTATSVLHGTPCDVYAVKI